MITQIKDQTRTKAASLPRVTHMSTDMLQRQCACGQHTVAGGKCEECRQKREGTLQRAAVSSAPMNTVTSIVHDVLSSPGQPLDAGTRAFMEPRFGHDFSQVRVHTDARAAESTRSVNAQAYTVGSDVVFGTGQYEPGTGEGRRLIAHELTHVVQQSKSLSNLTTELDFTDDTGEKEAEYTADNIMRDTGASSKVQSPMPGEILLHPSVAHLSTSLQIHNIIQRQTMTGGPDCDDLLVQIIARLVELKERAKAIVGNPLNLPPTGPMSVGGHQQQFGNKQVNLRRMLNQWNTDNCGPGLPADAWQWATRPIPRPVPVPTSSPRVAEPPRDGSRITGEDVAKGVVVGTGAAVGGYIIYRVVRFLPSLLPPLWWSIPANAAIP